MERESGKNNLYLGTPFLSGGSGLKDQIKQAAIYVRLLDPEFLDELSESCEVEEAYECHNKSMNADQGMQRSFATPPSAGYAHRYVKGGNDQCYTNYDPSPVSSTDWSR